MKKLTFKKFIIASLFIVAVLIIVSVLPLINRIGKTKVTLVVAPHDSKVTLDGRSVAPGEIYVSPGDHTFSAKRTGFSTDTTKVTVTKKSQTVGLVVDPVTAAANKLLIDKPDLQQEREAVGGLLAEKKGKSFQENNSIVNTLPFSNPDELFAIDYSGSSPNYPDNVTIIIKSDFPEGRANALAWIKQQGYNPTDLLISYEGFINPIENYQVAE